MKKTTALPALPATLPVKGTAAHKELCATVAAALTSAATVKDALAILYHARMLGYGSILYPAYATEGITTPREPAAKTAAPVIDYDALAAAMLRQGMNTADAKRAASRKTRESAAHRTGK